MLKSMRMSRRNRIRDLNLKRHRDAIELLLEKCPQLDGGECGTSRRRRREE